MDRNAFLHPLSARSPAKQPSLNTTSSAVTLSGGVYVQKQGNLEIKMFTGFVNSSWKKKYCILRNGEISIYSPKEVEDIGSELAEKEMEIKLVDIRSVEYKRGSKNCTIYFSAEAATERKKKSQLPITLIRKASKRTERTFRRKHNRNKNSVNANPFLEATTQVAQNRGSKLLLKADIVEEIEDWIQHLILDLKNQALLVDNAINVLLKRPEADNKKIEELMRQSIDLWTLATGRFNVETADAQERLSSWLEADLMIDRSGEAVYWALSAKAIRDQIESQKAILKNWYKVRTAVKKNMKEILDNMRSQHHNSTANIKTGFEELQEETNLFGLSKIRNVAAMNEVEKMEKLAKNKEHEQERIQYLL